MPNFTEWFDLSKWSTIANLVIVLVSLVNAGITFSLSKDVPNKWKKYVSRTVGVIGALIFVTIAGVAIAAPSGDERGLNQFSASVEQIADSGERLATAFENFVGYFAGRDNGDNPGAPGVIPAPSTPSPTVESSTPTPTVDTGSGGQNVIPGVPGKNKVGNKDQPSQIGNLVTCLPPNPPNNAWIWLYRLDGDNWYRISKGIGTIDHTGYLKINGLPIDITRYGGRGELYRIEKVIDGTIVASTGNFQEGEPEFRIYPGRDNYTSWSCP